MKYYVFGTGTIANRYVEYVQSEQIVSFLDNNPCKCNLTYKGKKVISPLNADFSEIDYVLVLIQHYEEVIEQLIGLGVKRDKIKTYLELNDVLKNKLTINRGGDYFSSQVIIHQLKGKKVLVCCHDLSRTGVPVASMHMAELFREMGWDIVMASLWGGSLEKELEEKDIPYIDNLHVVECGIQFEDFINSFDFLFIGTLTFAKFAKKLDFYEKPMIWWFNESYIGEYREFVLPEHRENMFYFADGDATMGLLREFYPERSVKPLFYFLPDDEMFDKDYDNDSFQVMMAAFLTYRKAPDVFVDAVRLIAKDKRKHMKFVIVGGLNPDVNIDWEALKIEIPEIKYIGEVNQHELEMLYSQTDVFVCPSRSDTEPIVVTQAFQHSIPCIVSDQVGQSKFMMNGEAGFVFKNEDCKGLADCIVNCYEHYDSAIEMGKQGRVVFEKYFSKDAIRSIVEKDIFEDILA